MPRNKKPRKKYTPPRANYQPILAHAHCPAEVRYGDWGPHKAMLWCQSHKKMIMWLSEDMAPKWAEALATLPGISSQ
jgi:hypothetical protein